MTTSILDVVAALVWRDGRLLVTQRPHGKHLGGLWEFPGGKVEPGEAPEDALVREVREELDVEIQVLGLRRELVHAYPEKTVRLRFFDGTLLAGEPRDLGVAAHRWVEAADLATLEFPPADRALLADLAKRFGPF